MERRGRHMFVYLPYAVTDDDGDKWKRVKAGEIKHFAQGAPDADTLARLEKAWGGDIEDMRRTAKDNATAQAEQERQLASHKHANKASLQRHAAQAVEAKSRAQRGDHPPPLRYAHDPYAHAGQPATADPRARRSRSSSGESDGQLDGWAAGQPATADPRPSRGRSRTPQPISVALRSRSRSRSNSRRRSRTPQRGILRRSGWTLRAAEVQHLTAEDCGWGPDPHAGQPATADPRGSRTLSPRSSGESDWLLDGSAAGQPATADPRPSRGRSSSPEPPRFKIAPKQQTSGMKVAGMKFNTQSHVSGWRCSACGRLTPSLGRTPDRSRWAACNTDVCSNKRQLHRWRNGVV